MPLQHEGMIGLHLCICTSVDYVTAVIHEIWKLQSETKPIVTLACAFLMKTKAYKSILNTPLCKPYISCSYFFVVHQFTQIPASLIQASPHLDPMLKQRQGLFPGETISRAKAPAAPDPPELQTSSPGE